MPEPPCPYCKKELVFIGQHEISDYYRCNNCRTIWDFMMDSTDSELIDVTAHLRMIGRKKVAS